MKKQLIISPKLAFIMGLTLVSFGIALGSNLSFISNKIDIKSKDLQISLRFSPKGGCSDLITREISDSGNSILMQTYSFTSSHIAQALINAHKRGVKVQILADKSQRNNKYSKINLLHNHGISVKIHKVNGIAHNKIIIIDSKKVITGSYNWTKAAENRNAENLIMITSKKIANLYTENWHRCSYKSVSHNSYLKRK